MGQDAQPEVELGYRRHVSLIKASIGWRYLGICADASLTTPHELQVVAWTADCFDVLMNFVFYDTEA